MKNEGIIWLLVINVFLVCALTHLYNVTEAADGGMATFYLREGYIAAQNGTPLDIEKSRVIDMVHNPEKYKEFKDAEAALKKQSNDDLRGLIGLPPSK